MSWLFKTIMLLFPIWKFWITMNRVGLHSITLCWLIVYKAYTNVRIMWLSDTLYVLGTWIKHKEWVSAKRGSIDLILKFWTNIFLSSILWLATVCHCWPHYHTFAYVAHLWLFRYVWILIQSAAVAAGSFYLLCHPSLAIHLLNVPLPLSIAQIKKQLDE